MIQKNIREYFINVCGEKQMTLESFAESVIEKSMEYGSLYVYPIEYTSSGFTTNSVQPVSLSVAGTYAIFRENELHYIGQTELSIRIRIARFIKEARGLSRYDENHPAAEKWRKLYGKGNLEGMNIMFCPASDYECDAYSQLQLESELIRILKPKLNVR